MEDGTPSDGLYVVRSGSMELAHGDQVVVVLEPGEAFGHPSLLTGLAPAFTVRAREPSVCLVLPRDPALRALGHPDGTRFVAATLREWMVRTGHVAHGLPELTTTKLAALITKPPLSVDASATVGETARRMSEAGVGAALVQTADGLGVVDDADLRARILATGQGPEAPLRAALRPSVLTLSADQMAGEALVAMFEAGVREVCVLDPGGAPLGLISAQELLRAEHDPFVLQHQLARAPDEAALAEAARSGLPHMLVALVDAGLDAGAIARVLSAQCDAATTRLLDFAFERHGPAPAPWAWLALGSVARREMTLASDQDNAFAYAAGGGPEADAYFAALTADVNAGLAACGFGPDRGDVLARDPHWRMTDERWVAVLRECLEHPDRSGLVRAAVSFDFRHVAGGLSVVAPLVAVIRDAPSHPDFLRRLARTATDVAVPLPPRTRLRRAPATIDLKRGAVLPIANLARLHALSAGVTISSTLDRLVAAERLGALPGADATALREAFLIVSGLRMRHHADAVRAGGTPDNAIEPAALPPLARAELHSALRAIADAQRHVEAHAPFRR